MVAGAPVPARPHWQPRVVALLLPTQKVPQTPCLRFVDGTFPKDVHKPSEPTKKLKIALRLRCDLVTSQYTGSIQLFQDSLLWLLQVLQICFPVIDIREEVVEGHSGLHSVTKVSTLPKVQRM